MLTVEFVNITIILTSAFRACVTLMVYGISIKVRINRLLNAFAQNAKLKEAL